MKKQQLKVAACVAQAEIPVMFMGTPGGGKTSWVRSFAEAIGAWCEVLIGSIMDPVDVGGLLANNEGCAEYLLPGWARRIITPPQECRASMLFIDETTCAPPLTQGAMLRILSEGAIHNVPLRVPGRPLIMIGAANPPEQAAGGYELAAPMANRFWHGDFNIDLDSWIEGMMNGWKSPDIPVLPDNWRSGIPTALAEITAYLRKSPADLDAMPKNEQDWSGPWASKRTWDYASKAMAACRACGLDYEYGLLGLVGPGITKKFCQYQRSLDLPDPVALLKNPAKWNVPDRDDIVWIALNTAISTALLKLKEKPDYYVAAWELCSKAIDAGKTDIAAVPARTLAAHKPQDVPKEVTESAFKFYPILKAAGIL